MNKSIDTIEVLQALIIKGMESLENRINNLERGQKTLRDEFAMAALPGAIYCIAHKSDDQVKVYNMNRVDATVKVSYEIADAMMEHRSKS